MRVTLRHEVQLVVEARGRAVADVRLGDHRVGAARDHPRVAAAASRHSSVIATSKYMR